MMLPTLEVLDWLRGVVPVEIKQYYWAAQGIYLNAWFWVFTISILVMERMLPADRKQRMLSPGLAQDFFFFNLDAAWKVALIPAVVGFLRILYDSVTGGYELPGMNDWSLAAKVIVAVLFFDFLQWFHHWVRHKGPLWHFHAIHHSQREMNVFTDLRIHAGEYVIADVLVFVPMFAFGLTPLAIMGVGSVRWWYTRFIHANIRTNMGWLKYILVTPQFHRVHHSIEVRHQDKNFGVVFNIWDRLFGTMYHNYDEYPATGVEGLRFDPPRRLAPAAWARQYLQMFVYPFRTMLARKPGNAASRAVEPDQQMEGAPAGDGPTAAPPENQGMPIR